MRERNRVDRGNGGRMTRDREGEKSESKRHQRRESMKIKLEEKRTR